MAESVGTESAKPHIVIARIGPTEWEAFRDIRKNAVVQEPKAFADTGARNKEKYSPEDWKEKLTSSERIWLGAKNQAGQLVGIIGAMVHTQEFGLETGRITSFYVSPENRGGVGRQLFGKMLEELRRQPQITQIQLEVTKGQAAAIALYKSFGFEQVDEIPDAVEVDGVKYNELVMRLQL